MPKTVFINLPVADVEKSATFYEGLGFTRDARFSQPGQAAAMVWSEAIHVMLLSHAFFQGFTPKRIADAAETTEVLICLSLDSRDEVNTITQRAGSSGGTADVRPAQDMGFMYSRAFADPDGHMYEPMVMDLEAALAAMSQSA